MFQIIKVKNDTLTTQTWCGKELAAAEEHTIVEANILKWKNNSSFLAAITAGDALIGDGATYFSDASQGIDWLKGTLSTHIADPFPDNESGYSFRGMGDTAAVTAGANDVDVLIHATEARLVNGAEVWLDSTAFGSYVTFQVVDVDNVLGYGAGLVVEEFGDKWQIHPGVVTKAFPGYVANIPIGLYIRFKVNSADTTDFYFNIHLHKY